MLVITRQSQESFVLLPQAGVDLYSIDLAKLFADGPITIKILGVRPKSVRIGIDAPSCITILRTELLTRNEVASLKAAVIMADMGLHIVRRRFDESFALLLKDGVDIHDTSLGELFADGPIRVNILGIDSGQVKLVVNAPNDLAVSRSESLDHAA